MDGLPKVGHSHQVESEWGSSWKVSLVLLWGLSHLPHWENQEQGWEAFLGIAEEMGATGQEEEKDRDSDAQNPLHSVGRVSGLSSPQASSAGPRTRSDLPVVPWQLTLPGTPD